MAGALRKTMVYLGLSEQEQPEQLEEHYEEYEDEMEDFEEVESSASVTPIRSTNSATLRRITTVHPRQYNDAKLIGEAFRAGTPVIMNLTEMSDADAKRLVDFAAGLVFGLRGAIERVTNKVFLLSPATVEISTEQTQAEGSSHRIFG